MLVDRLESKHALADYALELIGVQIVADYLSGQHDTYIICRETVGLWLMVSE